MNYRRPSCHPTSARRACSQVGQTIAKSSHPHEHVLIGRTRPSAHSYRANCHKLRALCTSLSVSLTYSLARSLARSLGHARTHAQTLSLDSFHRSWPVLSSRVRNLCEAFPKDAEKGELALPRVRVRTRVGIRVSVGVGAKHGLSKDVQKVSEFVVPCPQSRISVPY